MTVYGYARSARQGRLNEQIEQLKSAGCEEIFYEVFSGTTIDRPHIKALLEKIKERDTLIITSFDRLTRSAQDGIIVVRELLSKGVIVHILDLGIVEDSPISKIPFDVLSSFVNFEKNVVVERLLEGKDKAKQSPYFREGRKAIYSKEQFDYAMKLLETNSFSQVSVLTGISKSTLLRESKKRKQQSMEK